MENNFKNLDEFKEKVPEGLKNMLISELNVIRNTINVANIFVGVPFQIIKMILDESKNNTNA